MKLRRSGVAALYGAPSQFAGGVSFGPAVRLLRIESTGTQLAIRPGLPCRLRCHRRRESPTAALSFDANAWKIPAALVYEVSLTATQSSGTWLKQFTMRTFFDGTP
jgi:hypothetical protein